MPAVKPDFIAALKAKQKLSSRAFLCYYDASNVNSIDAYIQLFNAANTTAVNLGTTVPDHVISVPPGNAAGTNRGKAAMNFGDKMPSFPAGLIAAVTTTPNGNTAVTTGLGFSYGLS